MCVINMMVFVCCQLKVSLTDGWTLCDDVTSSSQLHCRGDDRDDIDIVFDMSSSAAMIDSVHVMSSVFCYYVSSIQGWVSAGRNLFLPDMRFKPV